MYLYSGIVGRVFLIADIVQASCFDVKSIGRMIGGSMRLALKCFEDRMIAARGDDFMIRGRWKGQKNAANRLSDRLADLRWLEKIYFEVFRSIDGKNQLL